jgi:hypothetical protein
MDSFVSPITMIGGVGGQPLLRGFHGLVVLFFRFPHGRPRMREYAKGAKVVSELSEARNVAQTMPTTKTEIRAFS